MTPRCAIWLSTPNTAAAEIARDLGYEAAVLDIEHGAFNLAALESFIPFLRASGFDVLAKVLGPEQVPIQQALDFGANAVIIPHIKGAEHARSVTSFAKFPPLGDRSFAGGRTSSYGGFDASWVKQQDGSTKCYPMIEDAGALLEIDAILALPTVDGVFLGPSDLSLRRGRGAYQRTEGDFADFRIVAEAADRARKPWIIPAWSNSEKQFAVQNGADLVVLTMEHSALLSGMSASMDEITSLIGGAAI